MKNLVIIQSLLHQIKQNRENIERQLECLDVFVETIEKELESLIDDIEGYLEF